MNLFAWEECCHRHSNPDLWPLVILIDRDKMTLPLVLSRIADRFGAQD